MKSERLQSITNALADSFGITPDEDDPFGFSPLPPEQWSKSKVYHPNCYICKDKDFSTHGLPLCYACTRCGGHVAADDSVCDVCGYPQPTDPSEEGPPRFDKNGKIVTHLLLEFNSLDLIVTENGVTRPKICIRMYRGSSGTICGKSSDRDLGIPETFYYPTCHQCTDIYFRVKRIMERQGD